jgi:RsmE family RNA methyltransferase
MEIAEPLEWSEFIDATRDQPCRLLAHPQGAHSAADVGRVKHTDTTAHFMHPTEKDAVHFMHPTDNDAGCVQHADLLPPEVFLAIGPEGGFTSEEVAMAAKSGWQTIDLGPRILRIETAALALVATVTIGRF